MSAGGEAVAEVKAGAFGTKYLSVADPDALQVGAKFYAAPPDTIPVEAVREVFAELMARVAADKPQCTNDDGSYRSDASRAAWNFADGLEHAADKIYELIKERSNG